MDWGKYFKTHGDFVLAQMQGDKNLYEVAVNVLCIYEDRVLAVDDIMLDCPQFNPSKGEFEAWEAATKDRVLQIAEKMTGVPRQALVYVMEEDIREQKMSNGNALGAISKLKAIAEINMKEQ